MEKRKCLRTKSKNTAVMSDAFARYIFVAHPWLFLHGLHQGMTMFVAFQWLTRVLWWLSRSVFLMLAMSSEK